MPTEFEGLTADEAVQRARIVLGSDAPVRCWKTRRGGVLGFFSQEIFIAGVSEPARAVKSTRAQRPSSSAARELLVDSSTFDLDELVSPSRPMLAELVESTRDELTLDGGLLSQSAFRDVLAEAEAALGGRDASTTFQREVPRHVAPHASTSADSRRAERLSSVLATLGVPSEFHPDGETPTIDSVMTSLDALPEAQRVPTHAGSVIVVVGARRDANHTAQRLIDDEGHLETDLITFDDSPSCRQRLARRRSSGKVSVVVVEASSRARGLGDVATRLEKLRPDYVLACVPATLKRGDVEQWRAQLGRVDALALTHWNDTASPAELLGIVPILYVEGHRASTIRWALLILEACEGNEP